MRNIEDKILSQLAGTPTAALATIDEGLPRVRYMLINTSSDVIIRSHTKLTSRKVASISANPYVHLCCGHSELVRNNPHMEIRAVAKVTTDENEKHNFWKDSMKKYYDGPKDPSYAVIIMLPILIEYCGNWETRHEDNSTWEVNDSQAVESFINGTHPILAGLSS